MQNGDNKNGRLKLEPDDKIVSFEFDDTFIKFRFAEGRSLCLTLEDIGEDMLKKLKKLILQEDSIVDFLLSQQSLVNVIRRNITIDE